MIVQQPTFRSSIHEERSERNINKKMTSGPEIIEKRGNHYFYLNLRGWILLRTSSLTIRTHRLPTSNQLSLRELSFFQIDIKTSSDAGSV